jgi:uncharacterized protein YlxP (DUF503 family)
MVIGISRVTLIVHESRSLKAKRQALKSIIAKVKNRFNVSIAEVADNDSWQKATLGIAAVGNDRAFVNSVLDKTLSFIEGLHLAEVADSSIEVINL